ncbi:MAG TPA: hypothetical protein VK700_15365 [Steroidobacteraceae bacterium]|jgi:hypothetical protein|nr:hypothetical protein [Steroidobacteraceae bacterium]
MIVVGVVHAGPEITFYLTVPLGGPSLGHVLGLRLDRSAAPPAVRIITPDSPLNRRALLDFQFGADRALRLDLDRRLTWDINRQQWRDSTRPPTFALRLPSRTPSAADHSARVTNLTEPFQYQAWKPLVKPLAIEP